MKIPMTHVAHFASFTLAIVALVFATPGAEADTFGSGANTFTIDFVTIGNHGNGNDVNNPYPGAGDGGTANGGVGYVYRMGILEISRGQVESAISDGLANITLGTWNSVNHPASFLSWYEAAAFVNWLNTTTGHQAAYDLTWTGSEWAMSLWSSGVAWQVDGENRYRHKDAYYFLPSLDEWYKSAYHKSDGVTANYWDYATGSDTAPAPVAGGTAAGTAVYSTLPGFSATVDQSGGLSPYGTRGQNGNFEEWIESASDGVNDSGSESREIRGGHSADVEVLLRSSVNRPDNPSNEYWERGFRVASVPEPSSAIMMMSGGLMWLLKRRRGSAI